MPKSATGFYRMGFKGTDLCRTMTLEIEEDEDRGHLLPSLLFSLSQFPVFSPWS